MVADFAVVEGRGPCDRRLVLRRGRRRVASGPPPFAFFRCLGRHVHASDDTAATVLGYYLILLVGRRGVIGPWLVECGINLIFSWQGAVVAATVVVFPLIYKSARAALELVDPRLENAARTLGASEWKVFWQVSLPLAWRGIVAGGMLAFARGMGEFGATLMIAGNIPGKTQTLALAIYDAFQAGNDEQATVLVVLTSCLCLTILVLADRLFGGKAGGR